MLVFVTSCTNMWKATRPVHTETNAVYYWKTSFSASDDDLELLKQHDIHRIYLRLFDVVDAPSDLSSQDKAIPNATVRFDHSSVHILQDSLRYVEFLVVIYVTLDALKAMKGQEGTLASHIVTRVRNMCMYHELPNVEEIQLDCDWTASTEDSFFSLCYSVKHNIQELKLPWRLSSTIRLHQLARKVPPVDNGVLMVYNTGNFNNPDANNSIIDAKDVAPYLKRLPSYPLHLDVAYPTYSWQLLYHNRKFAGLTNNLKLSDTTLFAHKKPNLYVAKKDIPHNNRIIQAGDQVRAEASAFPDIAQVKAMIEKRLSHRPHSNILYHLDIQNLSQYSTHEIDSIFSTGF